MPPVSVEKRKVYRITDRQQRVFELWKSGASLRAISAQLKRSAREKGESERGLSHAQLSNDLNHVLAANSQEFAEGVEHFRALQVSRLNDLYLRFLPLAQVHSDPVTGKRKRPSTAAGKLLLGVIRETSDLLGIRRPIKLEHSGEIGFNWSEIVDEARSTVNLTDEIPNETDDDEG
jgi:hypothetical protein